MKNFFFIAFILFTAASVYAQDNAKTEIAEATKVLASKISEELNLDDNETLYLQRALYSTEETRVKAKEQLSHDPVQLNAINEKIEQAFHKMLVAKFSKSEISSIKQLIVQNRK